MADRGRVTITLGRGAQVVKRNDHASDITRTDSMPLAGSKRSIRDRLGSSGSQIDNKRQRGTDDKSYQTADDIYIGRDDLRFKLMQKNPSRHTHGDDNGREMDLREKLSRTVQPPRGRLDAQNPVHEPKETNILWQNPSTSNRGFNQIDSSRSSFSCWTSDRLRRRSSDGMLHSSRGLSPPLRNIDELQRRPLNRSYDAGRAVSFMSNNVPPRPREVTAAPPFITKPTLAPGSRKSMAPLLGQLPSPSGIVQKSSYGVDEQPTVDGLLSALGLGKYAVNFKAEEVDMTALKQMGEHDLKEMGIPMGPRKKILLALAPRKRLP